MSPQAMAELAYEVAQLNHLSVEEADVLLTLIGENPEIDEDGMVVVRDRQGEQIARVWLPLEG